MSTVLFVCRQNAGRSQMSQALFEQAAGSRHRALSAGTTPAPHVHPDIEVMSEVGIDLSHRTPKLLTQELGQAADLVITMGCGDECPFIPGKRYAEWDLQDPAGQPTPRVREIRDDIKMRVRDLVDQLDEDAAHPPVSSPGLEAPLWSTAPGRSGWGESAHLDAALLYTDLKARLRGGGRPAPDGSVAPVEAGAVTGADDLLALHTALAERAATVRAPIVDGKDALAVAEEQDRRVIDDHTYGTSLRELGGVGCRRPLIRAGIEHRLIGPDALAQR